MNNKFHLAFKVKDLESTIIFYNLILGCKLGRQTEHWVDFNFFGHQLSAHVSDKIPKLDYCGNVENLKVPIPHFGCLVENKVFSTIQESLEKHKVDFIIKPQKRYKNKIGEQKTMFFLDYSNNPLEFKCFKNELDIFKD